eukprot:TRINITY_DN14410_c0_g1_i1.p1 TRINITY_DN14410_c0_g1~~TRINITY_DN14410_c0_g1_i1.p1  ORF type:complete len:246 (-),score=48.09 TRINITY_DN14410_c0_g1_i1:250-987(-)
MPWYKSSSLWKKVLLALVVISGGFFFQVWITSLLKKQKKRLEQKLPLFDTLELQEQNINNINISSSSSSSSSSTFPLSFKNPIIKSNIKQHRGVFLNADILQTYNNKKVLLSLNKYIEKDNYSATWKFREGLEIAALSILTHFAFYSDLYIITQCQKDKDEKEITQLLKKNNIVKSGLNKHKILFCSTTLGKAHIARQLGVNLLADNDLEVLEKSKNHIQNLVHVVDENDAVVQSPFPCDILIFE